MDAVTLDVEQRSATGKKVRALRRQKITPIHVYGKGTPSLSLQVDTVELYRTLNLVGRTTPLTLRVNGDEHFVVVREVQRHPVSDQLIHVDFLQVSRTERMRVEVPLVIEGEAPAARMEETMLSQDLHSVEVEGLPTDLPSSLTVDISSLDELDKAIRAADLELPPSVDLVTDPEALIVRVVRHRVVVEEAVVEEKLAEGEEAAAEGEEAAAATTEEQAAEETPGS